MPRFADYAATWLAAQPALVKASTAACYRRTLVHHVLPLLGDVEIALVQRAELKQLVLAKRAAGLAPGTVRLILAVAQNVLTGAVDDGVLPVHPGLRLGRTCRRALAQDRHRSVLAFTAEEERRFFQGAREAARRYWPYFFLLARSGLRPGEGVALEAGDIDLPHRLVHVRRTFSGGVMSPSPKNHRDRYVDLNHRLVAVLGRLTGRHPTGFLFVTRHGEPWSAMQRARAMRRACRAAGLRPLSPKALRHTYASRLIAAGVSPAYVQRQLGHASIQLTVDLYGRWLPLRNLAAVDALDAPPRRLPARSARKKF